MFFFSHFLRVKMFCHSGALALFYDIIFSGLIEVTVPLKSIFTFFIFTRKNRFIFFIYWEYRDEIKGFVKFGIFLTIMQISISVKIDHFV